MVAGEWSYVTRQGDSDEEVKIVTVVSYEWQDPEVARRKTTEN